MQNSTYQLTCMTIFFTNNFTIATSAAQMSLLCVRPFQSVFSGYKIDCVQYRAVRVGSARSYTGTDSPAAATGWTTLMFHLENVTYEDV